MSSTVLGESSAEDAALHDRSVQGATAPRSSAHGGGNDTPAARPNRESFRAQALRITTSPPVVDGVLDDPVWQRATPLTSFSLKEPVEGGTPSERTEVFFCYDDDALYIGAKMHVAGTRAIQSTMSRRDNAGNSERILFSLDTYDDHRTAYTFGVTASGVRIDYYHPEDREFSRDYSFDPVWEAAVGRDGDGWTAELRIPFSQLRFHDVPNHTWGLNVNRWVPTSNEDIYWVVIPKQETGWSSRFGSLTGIENIRPNTRIEVIPYAAGSSVLPSRPDRANPFDGRTVSGRAGLDFKMGLGPNLTLDATVNPDFGQVEADPAEVNLSAYETFFSERRPFFVEGAQLLKGIGPQYFYSRRIGAPPHGSAAGDYVDMPGNTTILGAAKLTGRLAGGMSVGALAALTGREYAGTYDRLTAITRPVRVEPLTGYGVARLQQEFGPESSTFGFTATAVQRDLPEGDPLGAVLNRQAFAGGGDVELRFDGGTYVLRGYAGASAIRGSRDALLRAQMSSARYYQRPDARYVSVDSTRTSLAGYTASLEFSKNGGRHRLYGISGGAESPGFELNDAGILNTADEIPAWAWLQYRETIPGDLFRGWSAEIAAGTGWNFGGIRQYVDAEATVTATLPNFWSVEGSVEHGFRALNDDLTRGGPLMGTAAVTNGSLSLSGNYALPVQWHLGVSALTDELGSWSTGVTCGISYRSAGRWEASIQPYWSRSLSARQYVGVLDGGPPSTYGRRYLFSFIDRGTLSMQIRFNYAFTPDMTIELYAEPFAATGRYYDFGELPAARSRGLRMYGTDGTAVTRNADGSATVTDGAASFTITNRDFLVRSFRSNVVLRWEWLRGSTLFLVWQQNMYGAETRATHVRLADLDAVTAPGTTMLSVKLSYWLPVR